MGAVRRAGGKRWEGTHRPRGANTHREENPVARSILWFTDETFARELLRTEQESIEYTTEKFLDRKGSVSKLAARKE